MVIAHYSKKEFGYLLKKIIQKLNCELVSTGLDKFYGSGDLDPFPNANKFENKYKSSLKFKMLTDSDVLLAIANHKAWGRHIKNDNIQQPNIYARFPKIFEHVGDRLTEAAFLRFAADFNGDYIYKSYRKWKTEDEISVGEKYEIIFLSYAGIENKEDIEVHIQSEKLSDEDISTYTSYQGYHYNKPDGEIHEFTLGVDFSTPKDHFPDSYYRSSSKIREHLFRAIQYGLHDNNNKCIGFAYQVSKNLHVVLRYEEESTNLKDRIKIIINAGDNPKEEKFLTGTVLAASSEVDSPASAQIVLLNNGYKFERKEILRVRRYLILNRDHFIAASDFGKQNKFRTKNIMVDELHHFVGVWKMWRFDKEWNIMTSIFHVRDDYRSYCYTLNSDGKINSRFCVMDVCKQNNEVMSFTAFDDDTITRQFIIKYPEDINEMQTHGTFIFFTTSGSLKYLPLMRGIALYRQTEFLEKQFNTPADYCKMFNDKNKDYHKKTLSEYGDLIENSELRTNPSNILKTFKSIEELKVFCKNNTEGIDLLKQLIMVNKHNQITPPRKWQNIHQLINHLN